MAMGEHGSGTRTQLPNGRWRVAVTMADGRRVWRRARTERDAIRLQRELVVARERDLDPSLQTLAAWLRSWIASLRDAKQKRLAPRTLEHYTMTVEQHIIPGLDPLDRLPLSRVTSRRIQAWLDGSDGSPRTLHHHRAVLRLALNRAVHQRLLEHNPAAGKAIDLPDATYHGSKPVTADEAHALLTSSEGSRWHPLWRLAIITGLRLGELSGLTWDDIGPDSIGVSGQMQRIGGVWQRRRPKAARTLERIAIDPDTTAVLERHRLRMLAERQPTWRYFGHLFIDERGEPYDRRRVLTAFHQACDEAGIARRRFHDLRHANNELMKALGIAQDVRMARHGHSTLEMDRRYGRASEAQDREAVELLARAIG